MSHLKSEPPGVVESMEELFAIAAAMEQEAIEGYTKLAQRMRELERPVLAETFDRLVAEETQHFATVSHWAQHVTGKEPDLSALRWDPAPTFDDEGAGSVAPELLSAYRAFATAVRNEQRAFAFWTYVASRAVSDELRLAAEQMAREELQHMATLRRERRRAFHAQRAELADETGGWTLVALESRLAAILNSALADLQSPSSSSHLVRFAREAGMRANQLAQAPLGDTPLLTHVSLEMTVQWRPLCELLLDCYLDLGERLPSEKQRERAQIYASQMLDCISAMQSDARGVSPREKG